MTSLRITVVFIVLLAFTLSLFTIWYQKRDVEQRLDKMDEFYQEQLVAMELSNDSMEVEYLREIDKLSATVVDKDLKVKEVRQSKDRLIKNLRNDLKALDKRKAELAIALSLKTDSVRIVRDSIPVYISIDTLSQDSVSTVLNTFHDGYLTATIAGQCTIDSFLYVYNVGDLSIFRTRERKKDLGIQGRGKVDVTTVVFENENLLQNEIRSIENFKRKRWWEFWKK